MTATKTQAATKASPRKPATKTAPKGKVTRTPEEPAKATKTAPKEKPAKPEPKTLVEALTAGQTVLLKVRANGTKRSLPYLAVGSEGRKEAEAVAARHANGETIPALAENLNVSAATGRRFLTNLALAQDVEAGKFAKAWKPGTKEVVVHTVTATKSEK
jgi:hypothetical protein